jgi:Zn-dependent peptidase ImmA (M78 family)
LTDDHFWFTFFHEAGHLLLHGKQGMFLEEMVPCESKEEDEANEFAAGLLIPEIHRADLTNLSLDGREVMRFARKIGVSPGIVVGQLQHLRVFTRKQLNNLKVRYTWSE